MRHKHADLIKEWAEDISKPVQRKTINGVWVDCGKRPNFDPNSEYRFKPEVVRYRNYLYRNDLGGVSVGVISDDIAVFTKKSKKFIKWIDTEWQEVEYYPEKDDAPTYAGLEWSPSKTEWRLK